MGANLFSDGLRSGSEPNGFVKTCEEKWLIQKFGGTSVGKHPMIIVDHVVRQVPHSSVLSNLKADIL